MANDHLPGLGKAARRARAGLPAIAAAIALVLLGGGGLEDPLLVWNASASSPRGLYLVVRGEPQVGDFVIARPPAYAAGVAEARGYLGAGVPLVKTMAAGPGEQICARGEEVRVGNRLVAIRRTADRAGRALPWWSGCRALRPGEILLLGRSDPASFDSRYFGPVGADRVLGRAKLIWPA